MRPHVPQGPSAPRVVLDAVRQSRPPGAPLRTATGSGFAASQSLIETPAYGPRAIAARYLALPLWRGCGHRGAAVRTPAKDGEQVAAGARSALGPLLHQVVSRFIVGNVIWQ